MGKTKKVDMLEFTIPEIQTKQATMSTSQPNKGLESYVKKTQQEEDGAPPQSDNEIFLPIHDFVWFTDSEMQIISHPAFQRLGQIFQLGQAYLVYRSATHKRGEHVLGTVHVAQMIITAIKHNHSKLRSHPTPSDDDTLADPLSSTESIFIRLAALLHDIGHLPAGHTLEDELQLLSKHDEMDRIDLVLDRSHWFGIECTPLRDIIDTEYKKYLKTENIKASELASLIVAKDWYLEDQTNGQKPKKPLPANFRIEVCRNIVGNTICADFLDYIYRDWFHIGKLRDVDHRIFQYMEIRKNPQTKKDDFVISLGKKKRPRTDAITGIVNLLELRYELAEVVLFHRTKCKGAAMLERALMELSPIEGTKDEKKKWAKEIERTLLDHSDWSALLEIKRLAEKIPSATLPIEHLLHRKLYSEACTMFTRDLAAGNVDMLRYKYSSQPESPINRLAALRQLEADFKLTSGILAMYCPHQGMNAKIPEVSIYLDGSIDSYLNWNQKHNNILDGGLISAQLNRFDNLWRIHFFMQSDIWNTWSPKLRTIFQKAVKFLILNIRDSDEFTTETMSEELAKELVLTDDSPYYNQVLVPAAQWKPKADMKYLFGAPAIRGFFQDTK